MELKRWRLRIKGTVQGVGFRPTVWRHARHAGVSGFVSNTGSDVICEAEGTPSQLERFLSLLSKHPPPLAMISSIENREIAPQESASFTIDRSSKDRNAADTQLRLIPPDIATCDACTREILDPGERRFAYPFTNCTDCGPRYTIIKDLPYDRPSTSMADFPLCPDCKREYEDPADRRYHAQPIACPACGPELLFTDANGSWKGTDALKRAVNALKAGRILAVKGLGGYHLACLALDGEAVTLLRSRKGRGDKPFAVMVRGTAEAAALAQIHPEAESLLTGPEKPIVLLPLRSGTGLPEALAPGMNQVGIFLPYTPLHLLLLDRIHAPLVMTSANRSDEPIVYTRVAAEEKLGALADGFLHHNRPIVRRCEDSVASIAAGEPVLFRRARGYAPAPLSVTQKTEHTVLALGGHLKNTFCFLKQGCAFLSPHEGDLHHLSAYSQFKTDIADLTRLLDMKPELIAYDMHPDYATTRYAEGLTEALPKCAVQHHHAHIASCLAENRVEGPVIGVAFDGLGMGPGGELWGGEFLLADTQKYERKGFIEPVLLAGGERAAREPWRTALACIIETGGMERAEKAVTIFPGCPWRQLGNMITLRTGCIPAVSAGRLFDLAAALSGLCLKSSYEGQAPMLLEQQYRSDADAAPYRLPIIGTSPPYRLSWRQLVEEALEDRLRGTDPTVIATRFHRGLAYASFTLCCRLRDDLGIETVALSGGVFHNKILTGLLTTTLEKNNFTVYTHHRVPAGDGGISLGQAVIADRRAQEMP